jgi:uncharacterized repeat protein (TIGR03803 family)
MVSSHYSSKTFQVLLLLSVTVIFICVGSPTAAQAQTPTVLYNFQGGPSDVCNTQGPLAQGRDGNMYGAGARVGCGANSSGGVYNISTSGVENLITSFPAGFNGCNGGLTLGSDGNFYGVCTGGNPAFGLGSIYRVTPAGVFTDLYDFKATHGDADPPVAPIQAVDGNFYGTTSVPGLGVCGNVYKMTLAGVATNLHTFSGGDCFAVGRLLQASDGNLYGTLTKCALPATQGCIFRISTSGVYKLIHGFVSASGWTPSSGVIQGVDGNLYGTTSQGGPTGSQGVVYRATISGVITDLHDINSVTDGQLSDILQATDGSFYGVGAGGGTSNFGSIYRLTSANVFSASLLSVASGFTPLSPLIQDTNGILYGTNSSGGTAGGGTFFGVNTGDAAFVNLAPATVTGNVGASVQMFGQGFSGASVVKFGGVVSTLVTLTGTTFLTAAVPAGAHTGAVTVTTGATTLSCPQTYKVKPKITSFTPLSGPVGTSVTIIGTGLIQTTVVKFGSKVATSVTVNSDSQVTAQVPAGSVAGAVTISITTPGGIANSPKKFTVN